MAEVLKRLLVEQAEGLSDEARSKILSFYEVLLKENEIQNLTRLISEEDFFYGHVVDVLELLKADCMDYPAIDLGSGAGVPGLLAALIHPGQWILVEAEKRKAEYLQRVVDILQLSSQVVVVPDRIEHFLRIHSAASVVARAVGPVDRIYSWIRQCSTWNNLILLKGPGWKDEWERFQAEKYKNELKIETEYPYSAGPESKQRLIIRLSRTRVPRGTKK